MRKLDVEKVTQEIRFDRQFWIFHFCSYIDMIPHYGKGWLERRTVWVDIGGKSHSIAFSLILCCGYHNA